MNTKTVVRIRKSLFVHVAFAVFVLSLGIQFAAAQRPFSYYSLDRFDPLVGIDQRIRPLPPQSTSPKGGINTFLPTTSATWNLASNWDSNLIPNASDEIVVFNSPTAAQTVTLDGAKTVGTMSVTNNTVNVWTLAAGTGGPLTFDVGGGNASLTIGGTGNVVNVISVATVLNDTLNLAITDTATASVTGALQITGGISGAGGVVKSGDGRVSFATNAKTYTGSTTINAGILRTSLAGIPNATSGVTVNAGGQLLLGATASGQTLQFGASTATVVTLNGDGPTAGSGALANVGNSTTMSNNISLASDSTISSSNALTLTGAISGAGRLTKTGGATLALNVANTYSGGTTVALGSAALIANNDGALGTGNVDINATGGVRLTLQGGLTNNYISDNATLSLANGAQANLNYALGGTDVVGGLVLGGAAQLAPGTYGSAASGAMFQFDAFFTGTGTLTLIPEPSTWVMTIMGAGLLMSVQRFRRRKS
jgi:autotransporter-associated beta strand protein